MNKKASLLIVGVVLYCVIALAESLSASDPIPEPVESPGGSSAAQLISPELRVAHPQPTSVEPVGGVAPRAPILDNDSKKIGFQALLTDGIGDPLPDGAHTLDFFFYATEVGGLPLGTVLNVVVTTSDGIASAQVGPLDPLIFTGAARWMGITVDDVDDDPTGDELSPRIPMGSVPYAFRVDRVESEELADTIFLGTPGDHGMLGVYDGVNGVVTVELDGANNRVRILGNDAIERVNLRGPSWGALSLNDPAGVTTAELSAASTKTPGGELQLRDTGGFLRYHALATTTGSALNLYDSGSVSLSLSGIDGIASAEQAFNVVDSIEIGNVTGSLFNLSGGGRLETWDENNAITSRIGSSTAAGGFVELYQADGDFGAFLDGDATGADGGGHLQLFQADGQIGVLVDGESSGAGRVDVSNALGVTTVVTDGDEGDGGALFTLSDGSRVTMDFDAKAGGGGAGVILRNSNGRDTIVIDADSGDHALLNLRYDTGAGVISTIILDASETGTDGGQITLRDADGNDGVIIDGHEATGGGGAIYLYNDSGVATIEIDGDEFDDAGVIRLRNSGNTTTITLDPDFNGEGRIITQVLQVTGGADLSEQFEIHATGTDLKPGMVVVIDPLHPGELTVSRSAYDRAVAGVISGAGGLKPGMLMGQRDSEADGAFPVALTGRVYCLAVATNGAIQPGDLLTTSNTPGHCMKVTDHHSAQGAILGKAMTALESGQGLVLVLVSLQ